MFLLVSGITFGVFCVGYLIYSTATAKYQARQNQGYRDKVNKYTVQQGHPISNSYKHLEGSLLNDV